MSGSISPLPSTSCSIHSQQSLLTENSAFLPVPFPSSAKLKSGFLGCSHCLQSSALQPAAPHASVRQVRALSSGNSAPARQYEEYEVELEKPIGLKFYRGADGATYIDAIAPGGNADKTKMVTPGDRVIATSAVFGNEMWLAAEYGRTMYTIRQRIGTVAMKMEKRFGEREDAAVSREQIAAERNAGILGEAVREIQIRNYLRKMELKKQREADLDEGLKLYRAGKYQKALDKFDSVLGAKPEPKEEAVASYNVACCYSKLNQVQAGLTALEEALEAGFEDYKTIKSDPDLSNLRASPLFKPLIDKYDEPFINENAVNALKSVFGMFGKK